MTYSLYTRSFGSDNANSKVYITEDVTGTPAIVLSRDTGGVISNTGLAVLDSAGNLAVYLESSREWLFTLVDETISSRTVGDFSNQQLGAIKDLMTGSELVISYDVAGRVASVNRTGGRFFTFSYPDANHFNVTADDGAELQMVLNDAGNLVRAIGNFQTVSVPG